jgi:hypothetical protein
MCGDVSRVVTYSGAIVNNLNRNQFVPTGRWPCSHQVMQYILPLRSYNIWEGYAKCVVPTTQNLTGEPRVFMSIGRDLSIYCSVDQFKNHRSGRQ